MLHSTDLVQDAPDTLPLCPIAQLLSALSAGIVFGSFMMHMLPDTAEAFAEYAELTGNHTASEFPWSYCVVGCVFFILYAVDRALVAHGASGAGGHHHAGHSHAVLAGGAAGGHAHVHASTEHAGHSHISVALSSMRKAESGKANEQWASSAAAAAMAAAASLDTGATAERHIRVRCEVAIEAGTAMPSPCGSAVGLTGSCGPCPSESCQEQSCPEQGCAEQSCSEGGASAGAAAAAPAPCCSGDGDHAEEDGLRAHESQSTTAGASHEAPGEAGGDAMVHSHTHGHGHAHGGAARAAAAAAVTRAWVFTLAISVHALFDGLSLGAESSLGGFYSILIAVLAHKAFDGIATGAALHPAALSPCKLGGMLGLAAMATPLGVAIGLGVTEALKAQHDRHILAEAIIISMSAGSFLFIAIVELLPAALDDGRWVLRKLAAFALGYAAMAALASGGHEEH